MVSASMKKKVTCYKLKANAKGELLNSACECPAGQGPHATCKHIAAVCYFLVVAKEKGELLIEDSCTSQLQRFHHPKRKHQGPPLTIEETTKLAKTTGYMFEDPRPEKYRNVPETYQNHVRKEVIAYCGSTGANITLRYLFGGADLISAQKDHDYLEKPFLQYSVDRAVKVSESQAKEIEQITRLQHESKEWHEHRRFRLTASRFGEIAAITERRNIVKLCESMWDAKPLTVPPVLHGKMYEAVAITDFEKKFNIQVQRCGLFIDIDQPYFGASPDGLIGKDSILEVKCPFSGKEQTIVPGSNFSFLENQNGSVVLKKNHKYFAQIQAQLGITKKQKCYFVVYTFKDMLVKVIPFDVYFYRSLKQKVEMFCIEHWKPFVSNKLCVKY
uniref:uncharacterized protein LOC108950671 n=1 Tax=Ciona intestinalis TaxID=7719 RepID=UPI00089DCF65|nr:uncharacterized protein LOC108950671 [Ciona intestinalis]|eukprot:XP_018672258.1 uncharacterized protein LOC108950671 [Ciona intestinalis]